MTNGHPTGGAITKRSGKCGVGEWSLSARPRGPASPKSRFSGGALYGLAGDRRPYGLSGGRFFDNRRVAAGTAAGAPTTLTLVELLRSAAPADKAAPNKALTGGPIGRWYATVCESDRHDFDLLKRLERRKGKGAERPPSNRSFVAEAHALGQPLIDLCRLLLIQRRTGFRAIELPVNPANSSAFSTRAVQKANSASLCSLGSLRNAANCLPGSNISHDFARPSSNPSSNTAAGVSPVSFKLVSARSWVRLKLALKPSEGACCKMLRKCVASAN